MAEEYIHPELRNLAEDLDEEDLATLAAQCMDDFTSDEESRQQWMSMHADWVRLYYQKDRPINPPWEGSSTESIPILAEACNQFHARAFQAMFPNRKIIKAVPTGKPDSAAKARAERIGTHMSWQLMVNDKTYKRNKDRLLLSMPLHGSMFTKSYYCPIRKRNITENVRASDLVVPYGTGPRDLEDIERKTHVLWMPLNKAKKLHKQGFFSAEPEAWEENQRSSGNEVDAAHDDAHGLQEPGYADGTTCKILEQHRLWDLDDDDIAEPYIVWLDATTEQVLRVSIRWDTDELGDPTDDKEPIEYFTHYTFLENPDGFYGLGFGHLLAQINIAANKILRQTVDAATLANAGNMSGWIDQRLATKKGETQIQLGKFNPTSSSVEDISRGIFTLKFPGPQAALFTVLELLLSKSDRLATVTEAITGQTEKVMQPTTILALIEQSLQVFSTVYERVLGAWECELMKHYRLNRKYMDPEEYFAVLDISGSVEDHFASRKDYEDDFQVKPIADPKMSTERQKLAKAEAEYNAALVNPLISMNPLALWNASRRYFEAIGSEALDEILPQPNQGLPKMDDPRMENSGALSTNPVMPPPYPDQDHRAHIEAHAGLLTDPAYAPMLSDVGRQLLDAHIKAHAAMMYAQTESDDGLTGGAGPTGMEEAAGDGGVPTPPGASIPTTGGLEGLPPGQSGAPPGSTGSA
jgi:chaperonin GroES